MFAHSPICVHASAHLHESMFMCTACMCAQCMVHLCEAVLVILSYAYTYVHAHIDIFETPRNPPMLSHCTTAWIKCW